ncbi:unnamed protein product [Rodentolepis nana]|uniref:Actin n=1 Tax=Rodentolepis nana TaxID=102285 RepID=A0A0R3T044_RODNA|nr:unnamed protein product [Rodentolepis nana]
MHSSKSTSDQISNKHSPIYDIKAIVIDTGSSGCRVGFANEDTPKFVTNFEEESSPIHYGHIVDNDKLVKEWMKALNHLELVYSEYPFLITTPTAISRKELEGLVQNAFEVFKVPAMLPFDQSILSLYSAGKVSGLVLDCGHEQTSSVPIVEGKIYHPGVVTSQLGGVDVTKYLGELLGRQSFLGDIKETACRIHINPNNRNNLQKIELTLSNGEVILLGKERFEGPEILFTPQLLQQKPAPLSIQETIYHTIRKCDAEIRKMLYENMVLTGGSSMFANFGPRLIKCLKVLSPSQTKIKMDDTHVGGRYMAWAGGCLLAHTQSNIPWITNHDYCEHGAAIVHKMGTYEPQN